MSNPVPGAPVSKTKWVVALVCYGNIVTVILAILALTKADIDHETAKKYCKRGWIVYAIWVVVGTILTIAYTVFIVNVANSSTVTTY